MTNATTQAQFKEIRNERFTIISFKSGKRLQTYGNVSVHTLTKELKAHAENGVTALVYMEGTAPTHCSWDFADYA